MELRMVGASDERPLIPNRGSQFYEQRRSVINTGKGSELSPEIELTRIEPQQIKKYIYIYTFACASV